jgi:NitT/TauT family transport system permease protein
MNRNRSPVLLKLMKPRGTISLRAKIIIGMASFLLLLIGYTALSHHQHEKNPTDKTIPTWAQMYEGTINLCEDLRHFEAERFKIEDASHKMFPSAQNVWDGMTALRKVRSNGSRMILKDTWATLRRLGAGLGLGSWIGVVLGMFMGVFPLPEAFFRPTFTFIDKIPPTASMAIFFVLAKGEAIFVSIIVFGVVPVLALSVCDAVKDVPMERVHKVQTLSPSPMEIVWTVMFREVLPKISANIQYLTAQAIIFLIAAEMIVGTSDGIGRRIRTAMRWNEMQTIFPYLILLGIMGGLVVWSLRKADRKLSSWNYKKGGH